MDRTRWIIFGLICIAAISWLVFASRSSSTDVSNVNAFAIQRGGGETPADNVYGNPDAKVVLIEYGDYACPGCGSAHATVDAIKRKYENQLAFVYRHFPLTTIHPNALAAATAAEAAGEQGMFWEYHDLLFANGPGNSWENFSAEERMTAFEGFAKQLDLDVEKFKQDMQNPAVTEKISFDRAIGQKVGVNSTPTFFLGEERLSGDDWGSQTALDAKVRAALEAAGVKLPKEEAEQGN